MKSLELRDLGEVYEPGFGGFRSTTSRRSATASSCCRCTATRPSRSWASAATTRCGRASPPPSTTCAGCATRSSSSCRSDSCCRTPTTAPTATSPPTPGRGQHCSDSCCRRRRVHRRPVGGSTAPTAAAAGGGFLRRLHWCPVGGQHWCCGPATTPTMLGRGQHCCCRPTATDDSVDVQ